VSPTPEQPGVMGHALLLHQFEGLAAAGAERHLVVTTCSTLGGLCGHLVRVVGWGGSLKPPYQELHRELPGHVIMDAAAGQMQWEEGGIYLLSQMI